MLGTIDSGDRQLVLADIPGLIEGAAAGAGLGHEFLAHVERCRILIHLVDIAGEDPSAAYEAVRAELAAYGAGLELLPELVVLSKRDLVPDADADAAVDGVERPLGATRWASLPVVGDGSRAGRATTGDLRGGPGRGGTRGGPGEPSPNSKPSTSPTGPPATRVSTWSTSAKGCSRSSGAGSRC